MGKLKQYHNDAWETRAQGSGAGGSGTTFDTNFFATMSGDVTVANDTWTKATFDTITTDENSEWDTVNTKWVCQEDGIYAVYAITTFVANATGGRGINVYKNGAFNNEAYGTFYSNGSSITTRPFTYSPLSLVAGNYLEVYAYQLSGRNLQLTGATSYFSIHRLK
jgi:hypothetical protein